MKTTQHQVRRAAALTCALASGGVASQYDFVFDACANGQQIKCLSVVDEFTRECLAIDVEGSIRLICNPSGQPGPIQPPEALDAIVDAGQPEHVPGQRMIARGDRLADQRFGLLGDARNAQ